MIDAHLKILSAKIESVRKSLSDTEGLRLNMLSWAYYNYIDDSYKKGLREKEQALLEQVEQVKKEREEKATETKESMDSDEEVRKLYSEVTRRLF